MRVRRLVGLGARRSAAGAATVRLAVTKAAQMAGEAEFSYAINAARRSEKRRMHNFVRLLDYIICNALHTLLVSRRHPIPGSCFPHAPLGVCRAATACGSRDRAPCVTTPCVTTRALRRHAADWLRVRHAGGAHAVPGACGGAGH